MPRRSTGSFPLSVLIVAVDRFLDGVPPASGAVVKSTGIVSVPLALDGQEALSRILLVAAGAAGGLARRAPALLAGDVPGHRRV